MDLEKAIRLAVDTGEVRLGTRKSQKEILVGEPKMIIVSGNCPKEAKADLKHYCETARIKFIEAKQGSVELGTVCGKPFPVSSIAVISPGESKILEA